VLTSVSAADGGPNHSLTTRHPARRAILHREEMREPAQDAAKPRHRVRVARSLRLVFLTVRPRHAMPFSKVAGYVLRSEDRKWCRIARRQFHNMVNAHVVRAGYEPRGFMFQTMCYRIREAIARVE
jgi:hypothetical protein